MTRLTVAIPTYNRPQALARTLQSLAPQIRPGVDVLVVDNASPVAAADVVARAVGAPPWIRCIRHAVNVGGNTNILRALELAEGDWVWILGDDDQPVPSAVAEILAAIAEHPDADYFNFCTSIQPSRAEFTAASLDEFLDRCDSFSNTLFISAGVYRRSAYAGYLQSAFHYTHTSMPQVVLLLCGAMQGRRAVFSPRFIVQWEVAAAGERWPHYLFFQFAEVVEILPTCRHQRRMLELLAQGEAGSTRRELLRWALLSQLHHPTAPAALAFVAKGATLRAQLSPAWSQRMHWRATAFAARFLHRHQETIWNLWSRFHQFRHGRPLERNPHVASFHAMLFHLRG